MSTVAIRLSRRRFIAAMGSLQQSAMGATPRWKHPAYPSQSPGYNAACATDLEVQARLLESSHNDATLNEKGFQFCHSWSSKRSVSAYGPAGAKIRGFSSQATAFTSRRSNPRNERGRDGTRTIDATTAARRLLDERRHPLRSFTPELFRTSAGILDVYLADKDSTDVQAINASLELLERVVRELMVFFGDDAIKNWFCDPIYFNPLINKWKEAAIRGEKVPSAGDLVKKLQTMSTQLPAFRYNISTISMIMQVEIKLAHPSEAPIVAERLLDFVKTEAARTRNSDLEPSVYLFSQILNAWAESRLPNAPQRLEALLRAMRSRGVVPSVVSYNIILRFWARIGSVEKVEATLEAMARDGLEPTLVCMAQAVYCYAKAGQTQEAEILLGIMIAEQKRGPRDVALVVASAQNLMDAYRSSTVLGSRKVDQQRVETIERAEALVRRMEQSGLLIAESNDKMLGTLMDLYVHAGRPDKAETLFNRMKKPNIVNYGLLIKAYGICDRADLATELFQKMRRESRVEPNVKVFTNLINAWIKSTQPDAVEQSFAILQQMEQDETCLKLDVRPDAFLFNTLLQCLSVSKASDSCLKAEAVLDDMEGRYLAGDTLAKPNQHSYMLAMKACFQSGDLERADAIMKRMERSDTPPHIIDYNDILNHCSDMGISAAAEWSEQILANMVDLAKTNSSMTPKAFSYGLVMNAWARSGDERAADRMWKIYERMSNDNVVPNLSIFNSLIAFLSYGSNMNAWARSGDERAADRMWNIYERMSSNNVVPNLSIYNSLIAFLSKSTKREDVDRADLLLQTMEDRNHPDTQPDHRHYDPVMNGWIGVGDAESAARVLIRRVAAYTSRKVEGAKPSPGNFYLVTNALIRSGDLVTASLFLEKMQELHDELRLPEGPDLHTHTTLLSAWERSQHPEADFYTTKIEAKIADLRRDDK